MSKEVKYKCNLCGETKEQEDLYCLYWDSSISSGYVLLQYNVDKSDKHICDSCIRTIKSFSL